MNFLRIPMYSSRLNGDCGGRTQMASIICSFIVLLATFFFLPMLYYLPKPVLSAMFVMVLFPCRDSGANMYNQIVYVSLSGAYLLKRPTISCFISGEFSAQNRCSKSPMMTLFSMGAWIELSLMTTTLVLTLIWSVEVGVLTSVALSLILVVKKSSLARMSILVRPTRYMCCTRS